METLKKYKFENNQYKLYLEDTETKKTREFVSNIHVPFEENGIHYIAISDGNELLLYKYNIFCDPKDKKEKPLLVDIPESNYKKVKEIYLRKLKENELFTEEIIDEDVTDNTQDNSEYEVEDNILANGENKKVLKVSKASIIIFDCLLFALLVLAGWFFMNMISVEKDATKESIIDRIEEIDKEAEQKNNVIIENSTTSKEPISGLYDVSDIVKEVMPSVVSITSVNKETLYDFFYGYYENESISAGSGIIIGKNDKELLIATNSHVVSGSDNIKIYFSVNGEEEKEIRASIKGTDDDSDLAIVAVKLVDLSDEILKNIKIATIGNSSELELGDSLIAIGNALGYGQSVTTGVVSATDRMLGKEGPFIQTDAAINPGNSGGALINAKGEVIGINCAKLADTDIEGIGYAIPSSVFIPILEDLSLLETKEKVDESERGYLGILGTDISEEAAEVYGMPKGVFVSELVENGAASKSLLQAKDIIIKLNNTEITNMEKLQNELCYYKAGESVTIIVKRFVVDKYEEIEISIILGEKIE